MIPVRTVFPWLWLQGDGTIAADTKYYPFGTRMYVPGWGWGMVTDRGSAIKGPDRIDLRNYAVLGPAPFRTPAAAGEANLERGIEHASVDPGLSAGNDFVYQVHAVPVA
jgi:hypothetical protein